MSLLNCARCVSLCLRALLIIDTRLTHLHVCVLTRLPIANTRLTRLGTLPIINTRMHVFILKHISFQFFTRLTLHGVTNQYFKQRKGHQIFAVQQLQALFYKQHCFSTLASTLLNFFMNWPSNVAQVQLNTYRHHHTEALFIVHFQNQVYLCRIYVIYFSFPSSF